MVHLIIQQQALPKSTKTTSKNIHSPQSPTFSAVNFTLFSISMILFTTVHLCNSGGGPAAVSSIEPSSASSPSSSSSVVQPLNNNLWFSENKKEENADSIRTTASSSRRGQLKRRRELRSGGVFCENNGTLVNGRCECRYPHTGSRCADFACGKPFSIIILYNVISI